MGVEYSKLNATISAQCRCVGECHDLVRKYEFKDYRELGMMAPDDFAMFIAFNTSSNIEMSRNDDKYAVTIDGEPADKFRIVVTGAGRTSVYHDLKMPVKQHSDSAKCYILFGSRYLYIGKSFEPWEM